MAITINFSSYLYVLNFIISSEFLFSYFFFYFFEHPSSGAFYLVHIRCSKTLYKIIPPILFPGQKLYKHC